MINWFSLSSLIHQSALRWATLIFSVQLRCLLCTVMILEHLIIIMFKAVAVKVGTEVFFLLSWVLQSSWQGVRKCTFDCLLSSALVICVHTHTPLLKTHYQIEAMYLSWRHRLDSSIISVDQTHWARAQRKFSTWDQSENGWELDMWCRGFLSLCWGFLLVGGGKWGEGRDVLARNKKILVILLSINFILLSITFTLLPINFTLLSISFILLSA